MTKPNDKTPGLSQSTTNQPFAVDGKTTVNLFCGGHCFLPDGKLLIVGGHELDSKGSSKDVWRPLRQLNPD
jgi:hypothetical protein